MVLIDVSKWTSFVNDGIDSAVASVSYTLSQDKVEQHILHLEGMLLVKVDLKQAYCQIPIYPRPLPVRTWWEGKIQKFQDRPCHSLFIKHMNKSVQAT